MFLHDRVSVGKPRRTADGYLVADAKVARTGIQEYLGTELGRPDMPIVRVYRPPEEVFARDAMQTYAFRPMTLEHPSRMVDASNWRAVAVGQTGGDVVRDGECVSVPLVLMDADAIKAWESGKRELSMGYTSEILFDAGTTPAGEPYDAVQTMLRMNHLALVDRARGGAALRIGDSSHIATAIKWLKIAIARHERHMDGSESTSDASQKKMMVEMRNALKALTQDDDMKMDHLALVDRARGGAALRIGDDTPNRKDQPMSDTKTKTVLVDGLSVETTDAGAQAITKLQGQITDAQRALTDAQAQHAAAIAAKDGEIGTLKAELQKAKDAALKPADIDRMVADRAALVATAKVLAPTVKVEGIADADIRKAVVAAKLGDDFVKDAPQAEIDGMYRAIAKDAKPTDPVRDALLGGVTVTTAVADNGYGASVADLDFRTRNQQKAA